MKTLHRPLMLVLLVTIFSQAQESRFFPKTSFGGFAQIDYAGPHNEWDLNRCAPNAGSPSNGGSGAPCTAFARAALAGYLEFKPINIGPFKRLYVRTSPYFFFGDNLPQVRYSQSLDAIGLQMNYGLSYELPHGFEALLTQHPKMYWFGKYRKPLGAADLNNSPYGQFTSIGVRWKFGTFLTRRVE